VTYTNNPATPAQCPRCGFRALLSSLQHQVVAGRPTALRVCGACLDEDNPQLLLGRLRVSDPQVVRDPSPPDEVDAGNLDTSFIIGRSLLA
jgi:hypothetical protein